MSRASAHPSPLLAFGGAGVTTPGADPNTDRALQSGKPAEGRKRRPAGHCPLPILLPVWINERALRNRYGSQCQAPGAHLVTLNSFQGPFLGLLKGLNSERAARFGPLLQQLGSRHDGP